MITAQINLSGSTLIVNCEEVGDLREKLEDAHGALAVILCRLDDIENDFVEKNAPVLSAYLKKIDEML